MIALRTLAAVGLAAVLAGCNSAPPRDPEFAWVRPRPAQTPPPTAGAIYRVGYAQPLFEDVRASRVGDVLTIELTEATNASKSATTSTSKSTSTNVSNPTILGAGVQFDVPRGLPLSSTMGNSLETNLESEHDFSGSGEATQKNSLTGEISVTVAEVLPNGDLVVQGEKLLSLNQGHEYVRLSGVVRRADIAADNTVPSTKVADARIVYGGEGATQDSNVIGWLARFFISAIMPF